MRTREGVTPELDFSSLNLAYLIQAREIARHHPQAAATLLGISETLAIALAGVPPAGLVLIKNHRAPLVRPRHPQWWWDRLLQTLVEANAHELPTLLDHAALTMDP